MNKFCPLLSSKIFVGDKAQIEKNISKVQFPILSSPKYDGWRLFEYAGLPTTRSMKQPKNYHTVKLMSEFFEAMRKHCNLKGIDGEAIVGPVLDFNAMQNTTSGLGSYEGNPDFTYLIFDSYQFADRPYQERLERLRECFEPTLMSDFPWVQIVDHVTLHDLPQLYAYEQEQLALGAEGIMTRKPDGLYKLGRSTVNDQILAAWKRWEKGTGVILEVREQLHNANEATINALGHTQRSSHQENLHGKNTMGSVLVRDSEFTDTFSVGNGKGLDAALRQYIWDHPQEFVGAGLEYRYQDMGTKTRPRHPQWVKIIPLSEVGTRRDHGE